MMTLETILLNENIIEKIYSNLDDLLILIPELKPMLNFNHKHPHHHLDVFNHTLLALALSPNNFTIRLTLLLHDIGKPFCITEENNVRHYPNHGIVSSMIAKTILTRLNYDIEYIDIVCKLIASHDEKITMDDIKENYDFCYILYFIQYCDALAHHPLKLERRIAYLKETENMLKNASFRRNRN